MKYAIISDIHGNVDALNAVLKDALHFGVDHYIFVGDYCTYLLYPNEVVNKIRRMKNTFIIRGNEDNRISLVINQDKNTWTDGQFQSIYWCCRTLTNENLQYLNLLPANLIITDGNKKLYISHFSSDFIGDAEQNEFSSIKIVEKYKNITISKKTLLQDIKNYLEKNLDCMQTIRFLSDGIYIFGHTHVQWNVQIDNKYFINPGSCGLPLDGEKTAPYTVLDIRNDIIEITEHRVEYDVEKLIHRLKSSSLYETANIWSDIIVKELETAYVCSSFFIQFAEEYANGINDLKRPFSHRTWNEAYNLWSKSFSL